MRVIRVVLIILCSYRGLDAAADGPTGHPWSLLGSGFGSGFGAAPSAAGGSLILGVCVSSHMPGAGPYK